MKLQLSLSLLALTTLLGCRTRFESGGTEKSTESSQRKNISKNEKKTSALSNSLNSYQSRSEKSPSSSSLQLRKFPGPTREDEEIFAKLPLENQKPNSEFFEAEKSSAQNSFDENGEKIAKNQFEAGEDSGVELDESEMEKIEPSQQSVVEDSAMNPEELSDYVWDGSGMQSLGNSSFSLCDGNVYLDDWQKSFDSKWLAENSSNFASEQKRDAALGEARSQEFLKLLVPALADKGFDFPVVINEAVVSWMRYFQTRGREAFKLWLARSEQILPIVRPVLEKNGLPQDLVYLAMIESGFNFKAKSFASAVGLWQFMRPTGKIYGLKVTDYVDERRNPFKSSVAAAGYLTYLYGLFGDWHLAAASYNAGEGRVARALRTGAGTNFFSLSAAKKLPNETRNYVPKLIAAMVISKNPQVFGFEVSTSNKSFVKETVNVSTSVSLSSLAKEMKISVEELEALNPELRVGVTPPISQNKGLPYQLNVPVGKSAIALAVLPSLPEASPFHSVSAKSKRKESLSAFAKRVGVPLKQLLEANPKLASTSFVAKGQLIALPVKLGSGQMEKLLASQEKKWKSKKVSSRKVKTYKRNKQSLKHLPSKTKGSREALLKNAPSVKQSKVKQQLRRAQKVNSKLR